MKNAYYEKTVWNLLFSIKLNIFNSTSHKLFMIPLYIYIYIGMIGSHIIFAWNLFFLKKKLFLSTRKSDTQREIESKSSLQPASLLSTWTFNSFQVMQGRPHISESSSMSTVCTHQQEAAVVKPELGCKPRPSWPLGQKLMLQRVLRSQPFCF